MAKIGHDTEFFLWDTKEDRFVPAHSFFPQQDEKGAECHYSRKDIKAFRDGFALEVNSRPVTCRAHLWSDITSAVRLGLRKNNVPAHIVPTTKPIVQVDKGMIMSGPPDVQVLGCNPTWNAYTYRVEEMQADAINLPVRTAGAHMHISQLPNNWDKWISNRWNACRFAKLCDFFIGIPAAVLADSDDEYHRRNLYGKAGEFRIQKYRVPKYSPYGSEVKGKWDIDIGFEYRSLSPRVYRHPAIYSMLWGMFFKFMPAMYRKLAYEWNNKKWNDKLSTAINTGKGLMDIFEDWGKVYSTINKPHSSKAWESNSPWIDCDMLLKVKEKAKRADDFNFSKLSTRGLDLHKGYHEYIREWKMGDRFLQGYSVFP